MVTEMIRFAQVNQALANSVTEMIKAAGGEVPANLGGATGGPGG